MPTMQEHARALRNHAATLRDTSGNMVAGAEALAAMLEGGGPTPPPRPPLVTPARLLRYPFDRDAMCNWMIGDRAQYGVPAGTLDPMVPNPVYDDGLLGSRAGLDVVKWIGLSDERVNRKYLLLVPPGSPMRRVDFHNRGGSGSRLPITIPMPVPSSEFEYPPDGDGDSELVLVSADADDPLTLIVYVFAQFSYSCPFGNPQASARNVWSYPLSGMDVRTAWDTPGLFGPGAIDWCHPAGFLQDFDPTGATPFDCILNFTATRHNRAGATDDLHVLSKRMCGRAWNTDRPMLPEDNLGKVPYGAIICVRREDGHLREQLGLSPAGKRLFDNLRGRGGVACDGQGQKRNDGATLQLRIGHKLGADRAKCDMLEADLQKIRPHLWTVYNMPKHNEPLPRSSSGQVCIGGGEPLVPSLINRAWNA